MTQYTESVDSADPRHKGASGKKVGAEDFTTGILRIVSGGSKRERRKSIVVDRPKSEKRQSYSVKSDSDTPTEMEYYRLKKMNDDWGLADVVPLAGNRDDMERKVYKSRGIVTQMINKMGPQRRKQITMLVDDKNDAEKERDAVWQPAHVETAVIKGSRTPVMYVILTKKYKTFEGKKSDIRGSGKTKDDKGGKDKRETSNYDDPYDNEPLIDKDGRPCDSGGPLHNDDFLSERLPKGELEPVGGRPSRPRSRTPESRRLKEKYDDDHYGDHYDDRGDGPINIVGEDDYPPDGATPVIDLDGIIDGGAKNKRGGHDKYERSHSRGAQGGFDKPTASVFGIKGDRRRPNSKSRSRPPMKQYHTDDPRVGHYRGRGGRRDSNSGSSVFFGSTSDDGGDTFSSVTTDERAADAYAHHHYDIKPRGSLSRHASPAPAQYRSHHRTQSYNVAASRPPSVRYYGDAAVYESARTPARRASDNISALAYERRPSAVRGLIGYTDGYDDVLAADRMGRLDIRAPSPLQRRYSGYDVPPPVPAAPDPYESRVRYVEDYTDDLAMRERRVRDEERRMDEIDYQKWHSAAEPRRGSVYGGSAQSGGRGGGGAYYGDQYARGH